MHVTPFPSSLLLVRLPWLPTLRNQKGREHRSTVFLPLLPAAPGRSIAGICWWDSVVRVLPSVWDLLVTCQLTDETMPGAPPWVGCLPLGELEKS